MNTLNIFTKIWQRMVILNVNRYFTDGNKYNFYFHKFPYDKYWQIIKNKTSWSQNQIHLLLTRKSSICLDEVENLFKNWKILLSKDIHIRKISFINLKCF